LGLTNAQLTNMVKVSVRDNVIPVHPTAIEEVRAPRELNEDRYRLKAPTFTGEEEVEQFIQ